MIEAVILGAIALIIAPGYFFYFDVTPKTAVLLAGTAVLLVTRRRCRAPSAFSALLILNLASLGISTALSSRPGLSLFGSGWREFGLIPQGALLLFAWLVAGNPENRRAALRGVAVASLAAGAYGIAQYAGWDPFLPSAAYHIGEGIWTIVRPPGTLGYVSYFATWLVMAMFLSLALAMIEKRTAWRRIGCFSAAVSGVAMLLTGTRAAMLGAAAGAGTWLFIRGLRITRNQAAIGAAILAAAAAFYFSPAGWNLRSRARWYSEDRSGGARPLLWRDTLRMAGARPIAGYGPEVFTAEFAKVESAELARQYPDFTYESPHNIFLDALAAQGVIGFLALAGVLALAFRGAKSSPAFELLVLCALIAGTVSQCFTSFTIPTAVLVYTCAAILIGQHGKDVALPRALTIPLAAIFVFAALWTIAADHSLALAKQAIERGDATGAAAAYTRYESLRTPGAAADLWYSRASLGLAQKAAGPLARLQALAQAQAAAARAPDTAEDPASAWYSLAGFDAQRNDAAAAEHDLRAAIQAHSTWFKPHWMLAQLLKLESRLDEASHEAALALALDGGKHPEVTSTLSGIRAHPLSLH
jgi:O-antigen ligase